MKIILSNVLCLDTNPYNTISFLTYSQSYNMVRWKEHSCFFTLSFNRCVTMDPLLKSVLLLNVWIKI